MDEPKTAGPVPADTEQPKEDRGNRGKGSGLPMEGLEDTLVRFEDMCLNGAGQHFRSRLKSRVGTRLHTMLARLGSLS